MEQATASELVEGFAETLNVSGLHAALRLLNGRTSLRFTGVYRFDPPLLRNVALFDRENPGLLVGADAPLRETYCLIAGETRGPFFTADATADERLREHPARETVIAYCGVPLHVGGGTEPFGTLCHFDLRSRPVPAEEILLLEAVAPLVSEAVARRGVTTRAR